MSDIASDKSKNPILAKGEHQSLLLKESWEIERIQRVQRRILAAHGWFRLDSETHEVAKAVLELMDALSQYDADTLYDADSQSETDAQSRGHAKTVLSTSEAAEILMVSRPFVVKLLEQGAIAFHKVGTHRRIKSADLYAYKERQDL